MRLVLRQFFAISLLACCTLSAAAQSEKALPPVYDQAKDETTYFLSPMMEVKRSDPSSQKILDRETVGPRNIPIDYLRMVVYYKTKGRSSAVKPASVVIAIESATFSNFQFRQYRDLSVTTDTEKMNLGKMTITGQDSRIHNIIGVRYKETLELPIATADYKKIIASKTVKMLLGDTSFSLLKDQLKALRAIAIKHLD